MNQTKPMDGLAVASIEAIVPGNADAATRYVFMKHLSKGTTTMMITKS
jgi:hypothetical protein